MRVQGRRKVDNGRKGRKVGKSTAMLIQNLKETPENVQEIGWKFGSAAYKFPAEFPVSEKAYFDGLHWLKFSHFLLDWLKFSYFLLDGLKFFTAAKH
jgi:hypothetical protein